MTISVRVNPHDFRVKVTHERKLEDGSYIRSHSSIIEPNSGEHVFNPFKNMRLIVEEVA